MASFASLSNAVRCAAEIQKCFSGEYVGAGTGLKPRIGLSAGAPVTGDADLFGDTIRNASMLSDHAAEGEVLLAPSIHEHLGADALMLQATAAMRAISESEQMFLLKLADLTVRVWNESHWNVADYGKMLGLSRSQMYRTTRALTGCSPHDFFRVYRLKKAAASIEQRRGTLSEIAFDAGFSSLSYFSKCFKRHFGILPSRYARIVNDSTAT